MKSLSDLWDSILSRLSGELSDTTIKTWFDEISVVTMEDSALVLHCSNDFKKNTVEARFLPQIKAALKDIFSTDMEVKILSDEQLAAYHGVAPDRPGDLFDSDAFTFETYVVGPQNKLAYAAAKSVAEKPAESYNPLFIYGDSGLGKTHLLYAIAHLVNRRRPVRRRSSSCVISRGGRSEVSTICLPDSYRVLKVWKNSSCVWILPAMNWISSTSSTVASRYFSRNSAFRFSRMELTSSLVKSSPLM